MSVSLEEAYTVCEAIAKREAKNFYYAFRVLPKAKREAICAVYAFMRHADDLADDEHFPVEMRLAEAKKWQEEWHRAAVGGQTSDPVFIALRDTQQRFGIASERLDDLVHGTLMDLTPTSGVAAYQTFDDLYRYCYYVASVVGLVVIRIFGYSDPRAEKLAEETGIAFQLTNILRDVREDAGRGRVYLPVEDIERHGLTVERLEASHKSRPLTKEERLLIKMEADRARQYYRAADRLLPMIDADSRAALWVLVKIYRRLLHRIAGADYEVLSRKIRVSTPEKIWILLRGFWMAYRLRHRSSRSGAS